MNFFTHQRIITPLLDGGHMGDWGLFGIPFMWFWMLGIWAVFVVIAIIVYKDAEERGMNGLLWLLLLIIPFPPLQVFALVVYLVLREERARTTTPLKSAPAILEERYARGEITRDEYLRMKEDIKS